MGGSAQKQLGKTKEIKFPNLYIRTLYKELKPWFLDEEEAPKHRGDWLNLFKGRYKSLHLEIGTGKGKHFKELCIAQPQDVFLGLELKYKPLAQTIELLKNSQIFNAKVIRYNASLLDELFSKEELNDVYIYFPDPWPKTKARKHRLLNKEFASMLFKLQKKDSLLKIRMDSLDYFLKSVEHFKSAGYKLLDYTEDLYSINSADQKSSSRSELLNKMTQFEVIFFNKKVPIKHATFKKVF